MKLLVAYDGSEGADDALTDLPSAGLPATAEATVVSVADVICLTPSGTDAEPGAGWPSRAIDLARSERLAAVEQMRSRAELAAGRIRMQFPRWTVHAEAHGDSPAWGILKRADALRPDLLVLGSHGSSAVGRFFLGSVSLKVLHAAACPVRIARKRRGDPRSAPRLLIGIDGSRNSLGAVRAVRSRSWPSGTMVRLVSAMDRYMSTAVLSSSEPIERWAEDTEQAEPWPHRMVADLAGELRGAGLEAEGVVIAGEPKDVLVEEADRWKADSVFVGSQGLSAIERAVLGSVSSAVAARASCSVEVVRSTES